MSRSDVIRIVPLHRPETEIAPAQAAPAPAPNLVYNGGPLLTAVEVFTIFWGSAWQQSPQSDLIPQINQFFTDILTSPLIDQLGEYSVQGQTIGYGSLIGTLTLTSQDPGATVADADIQQLLQQEIANDPSIAQPDANTLYFFYLPPGVTVEMDGSASCQAFCGYHDTINGQLFYAVMPYPDCSGCIASLSDPFDALTGTSSHELCESITDPIPGQGWYDNTNGEIGDICAWQFKQLDGYNIQLEWSNQAGSCL